MGVSSWLAWRAVCDDPVHGEPILDVPVPQTWQCREVRLAWIMARIDAFQHDAEHHPEVLQTAPELPFHAVLSGGTVGLTPGST
jgi:hypothetical protein